MSVSMTKGTPVSLTKENNAPLSEIAMGLSWQSNRGQAIDLDSGAIAYDDRGKHLATVYFGELSVFDGAIRSLGDDTTGSNAQGDGDNETIKLYLDHIPASVRSIYFVVNYYSGRHLDEIKEASCRIIDLKTNAVFGTFVIADAGGSHRAIVMCRVQRASSGWEVTMIGEAMKGHDLRTASDMVKPVAKKYL